MSSRTFKSRFTAAISASSIASATTSRTAPERASDIDLHYEGTKSLLTFDRAIFRDAGGRLSLTGTVGFPDRGPSPRFDIAVDATSYPIDRAMAAVNLK